MEQKFEMVAKTLKGLEEVLAEELRALGATNVEPGLRMVSFEGDLAMLYRANIACRTALTILKPIYKFIASDPESLYEMVKEYDWGQVLALDKTFSIDSTVHGREFTHSKYVTYKVKDAIVDWFRDRFGEEKRPKVRLDGADVMINVHIDGDRVTLSLNSSGESLHKRGWRVASTEAPINEVLAAGILLKSGWRGETPLVDPMCGSGTFVVEAALIAAGIRPGTFRSGWAFENWRDFDGALLDSVMAEQEAPRETEFMIYGSDISPKAVAAAEKNVLSAGVDEYVNLRVRPLAQWEEAPADGVAGVMVSNPPYGERLNPEDLLNLYKTLGTKIKKVFKGYHAWIISSNEECLSAIGLTPSMKEELQNGGLECELREYISFEGTKSDFRREGGRLKKERREPAKGGKYQRKSDAEWRREARAAGMGGKEARRRRDEFDGEPSELEKKYRPRKGGYARAAERRRDFKQSTREASFKTANMATPEAEELLGRKRSEAALKMLGRVPKQPTIAPNGGPIMRDRKKK
ncbi:MAG: RNA methyltransferase [Duncaniella sp.]|nr:RNA methyltransferase [Duncaniella sp.]